MVVQSFPSSLAIVLKDREEFTRLKVVKKMVGEKG